MVQQVCTERVEARGTPGKVIVWSLVALRATSQACALLDASERGVACPSRGSRRWRPGEEDAMRRPARASSAAGVTGPLPRLPLIVLPRGGILISPIRP